MGISVDRIGELVGEMVEKKITENIRPFTDELFEKLNQTKPNKLFGEGQKPVKKLHNFDNYDLNNDGGFSGNKGFSDFLKAVRDNNIGALNNCQITEKDIRSDVAPGSYLVPDKFLAQMLDFVSEESIVMPRATTYKLARGAGDSLKIPAYESYDFTSGAVSGISLGFVPEGGSISQTTPELRQVSLKLNKIAGYAEITDEALMSSAINASELLSGLFGRALSWTLDRHFILTGTGSGQPLACVEGNDFIGIAGEAEQDPGTVIVENISSMLKALHVGAWGKSLFIANVSLIDDLMRLAWAVGTSYIPCPAYNSKTGKWNIMGVDLKFSQHSNYIGSKNCIILADFSRYIVLSRDQMMIKFDPYSQAVSGKNRYIISYYVDGQSADSKVVRHADETSQVSSFVGINAIT
jgi:HK97 family phage major capsid protein